MRNTSSAKSPGGHQVDGGPPASVMTRRVGVYPPLGEYFRCSVPWAAKGQPTNLKHFFEDLIKIEVFDSQFH